MNTVQHVSKWKFGHPILAGVTYAFIWMALGALALSVLLFSNSTNEESLTKYTYIIHTFALLIGGWTAGRRSRYKGWYYGGLTGLLYALLIFIIGFLAMDSDFNGLRMILLIAAFGVSALGGIFGVNTKKPN
ncbi:TIGR04086 family membrane protein [Paenibacillus sp. 481]|uniref:TIGR04086 family membrane protein n=1 Tax=Paenibacillus sp. 481 TaxID=2835869 RepID=UPI001E51B214|nr:TIGR04086 family membrane protein [Paenibacillus sp. 481]UHA74329.1 TIGR04086 family membrane protein [Paenibacillus sp. 481]